MGWLYFWRTDLSEDRLILLLNCVIKHFILLASSKSSKLSLLFYLKDSYLADVSYFGAPSANGLRESHSSP